jgi:hypothetical protein
LSFRSGRAIVVERIDREPGRTQLQSKRDVPSSHVAERDAIYAGADTDRQALPAAAMRAISTTISVGKLVRVMVNNDAAQSRVEPLSPLSVSGLSSR